MKRFFSIIALFTTFTLLGANVVFAEENIQEERQDPKYWSISFFETGSYQFYDTNKKAQGEIDLFGSRTTENQLKWITLDVYFPIPKLPESIGINGGADVSAYLDEEKEMWSWNVGVFARVSQLIRLEGGFAQVRSKAFGLDSSRRDDGAFYIGVVTPTYAGDALGSFAEDQMGNLIGLVLSSDE